MRITDRDIEIFKTLNRLGTLKIDHISSIFWDSEKIIHRHCQKRLLQLTEKGLLKRSKGGLTTQYIYRLGREGIKCLEKIGVKPYPYIENMPWARFIHDDQVAKVLCEFYKSKFRAFLTDRELRSGSKDGVIVPDILFNTTKGNIAVEVELESKTHKRIKEKLNHYSETDSIVFVLYICKGRGILNSVRTQAHLLKNLNVHLKCVDLNVFYNSPLSVFEEMKTVLTGS